MGVGRPFWRIDLRYAKRDFAGFDLAPKPIELLEFVCVGAHPGCGKADIPLRNALEAADGREGAAIANGGDDMLIEHRAIREPIDSLSEVAANAGRDIISPSDDNIGAMRRNQLFIFLGSVSDDRQPLRFGELDDITAISARRASHCDDLTRRQLEQIE